MSWSWLVDVGLIVLVVTLVGLLVRYEVSVRRVLRIDRQKADLRFFRAIRASIKAPEGDEYDRITLPYIHPVCPFEHWPPDPKCSNCKARESREESKWVK